MFYVHALNSEHAQYALRFYVYAYWLKWTDHAHWRMFYVHAHCHLILRSGVLNGTLSHIWWRLYLPTFLLSVGLLTLMYIDSLIVLARPWYSLPIILKFQGWCCVLSGCCVHEWVRVPSGAPCILLQRSWMSPLCTSHWTWAPHTDTSRWPHSFCPQDPCLWVLLAFP